MSNSSADAGRPPTEVVVTEFDAGLAAVPSDLGSGELAVLPRQGITVLPAPPYSAHVPAAVQAAAAWSWRLLLIGAAILAVGWVFIRFSTIVIPVAIAVLIAVLLGPPRNWLAERALLGRKAATALCTVGSLVVLAGLIYFSVRQLAGGFSDLTNQLVQAVNTARYWLEGPPLYLTNDQFNTAWQQIQNQVAAGDIVQTILTGAVGAVGTVGNFFYGAVIAFFCTIFFLYDGKDIWTWLVNLLPIAAREKVHQAGRRSMVTLSAYVRTQMLVGGAEGVMVGIAAIFLVPQFALPIAVLVFVASFIPMLGALVAGFVACIVVLMVRGVVPALIMLGVFLLVQQIESHLLQPLLMGHAVSLHPVAVVIVVAVGLMIGGLGGALFAVPLAAVANTFLLYLAGYDKFPQLGNEDHVPLLRRPKVERPFAALQDSIRRVGQRRREAAAEGDVFLTDLGPSDAADAEGVSVKLERHHKPKGGEHRRVSRRMQRLRKRGLITDDDAAVELVELVEPSSPGAEFDAASADNPIPAVFTTVESE